MMYAEMTVQEACNKFDDFKEFISGNEKMYNDLITDDKYVVRVAYRNGSAYFEVGYRDDEWNIH